MKKIMVFVILVVLAGCVERTVTINTEPKGAIVWLNDKEVGRTPVRVPFKWYGDYDVIIRKEGYETLKTHRKLVRPWYEYIPLDLFAEVFTPAVIHDDHFWEFSLEREKSVDEGQLLKRALEFRETEQGNKDISEAKGAKVKVTKENKITKEGKSKDGKVAKEEKKSAVAGGKDSERNKRTK